VIAVLIAGAVSMLLSLFGTRRLIMFFDNLGKGQPILGSEDHGPLLIFAMASRSLIRR